MHLHGSQHCSHLWLVHNTRGQVTTLSKFGASSYAKNLLLPTAALLGRQPIKNRTLVPPCCPGPLVAQLLAAVASSATRVLRCHC